MRPLLCFGVDVASSFPLITFPDTVKITFADTNAVLVNVSENAVKVSVYFVSTAGTVAFTGTDGGAVNANAAPIPADGWHEFNWSGSSELFVAGSADSVCHVIQEGRTVQ